MSRSDQQDALDAVMLIDGEEQVIKGHGRGVLEAFTTGLKAKTGREIVVIEYNEHTLGKNDGSNAMAYVQISIDSQRVCAAGKSRDILGATLNAILNAVSKKR